MYCILNQVNRTGYIQVKPLQSKRGDNQIGVLGILHPTVIQDNRLQATGIMGFNLNELVNIDFNPHYKLVSKYPATTRDTTYIMDQKCGPWVMC